MKSKTAVFRHKSLLKSKGKQYFSVSPFPLHDLATFSRCIVRTQALFPLFSISIWTKKLGEGRRRFEIKWKGDAFYGKYVAALTSSPPPPPNERNLHHCNPKTPPPSLRGIFLKREESTPLTHHFIGAATNATPRWRTFNL